MTSKPLLVGEANPYGADPAMALYPLPAYASGGRLQRVLGVSVTEYLRKFDRANLCPTAWSLDVARRTAAELLYGGRRVYVLLGAKVCSAFRVGFEPFTVVKHHMGNAERLLVVLPHPSGLSRAWNAPDAAQRARDALKLVGVDLSPLYCQASRGDGECNYEHCPQLRDGEPRKSGRDCPALEHDEED